MSNDPFAALPAAQRHTANSAIKAVLGAAAIATVRPITGGVSGAFVFLIEASGRRFVLRTEGPASPLRNPHQYFSMRIAADAGIAPRLHYLDANDRVMMMDFIEDRPLETYPGIRGYSEQVASMSFSAIHLGRELSFRNRNSLRCARQQLLLHPTRPNANI